MEAPWPGTYKFLDKGLGVVADMATDRILVIYDFRESAGRQVLEDLIGDLFVTFGEPTVSAHDTIVYWAFGRTSKYSLAEFEKARDDRRPLEVLATVKLQSEVPILNPSPGPDSGSVPAGSVYCVLSSDPVLRHFKPVD